MLHIAYCTLLIALIPILNLLKYIPKYTKSALVNSNGIFPMQTMFIFVLH